MKRLWILASAMLALLLSLGLRQAGQRQPRANAPAFTAGNELVMPADYREWVWVSSGLGMSYNAPAQSATTREPSFDNVFVTREAYQSFLRTGTWPDQTMFILEVRSSVGNESINQQGRFQGHLRGLEAEVKSGGKWAFFVFENTQTGSGYTPRPSAKQLQPPDSDSCHSCHSQHGAVDNTFVQFYPTLMEVARQKGTLKNAQEPSSPKQ